MLSSRHSNHRKHGHWEVNCFRAATPYATFTSVCLIEISSANSEGLSQDANVRFFGAHTLTVKISRDWPTLPEEHWTGLKEAMLGWLAESARSAYPPAGAASVTGERVVFRKLAVAVRTCIISVLNHYIFCRALSVI